MMKLAIIGASDLQLPLILKAKERGIETHVFAWEDGAVGKEYADFFYPISIVEIESIEKKCMEIGIDGICTIATDLGNITSTTIANRLRLTCNSMGCLLRSTNKSEMRRAFREHGDPSPSSYSLTEGDNITDFQMPYPIIVKPADRSGSRGITKLYDPEGLEDAVKEALGVSFSKVALVEEYVVGKEYSVEYISWNGDHRFLALTRKYTTGSPHFIETAHVEPASVDEELLDRIKLVVENALNGLGVKFGASHSEIKVSEDGEIKIIEIGSRMGGDCIGSSLVEISTGIDFLSAVIDVALGIKPHIEEGPEAAGMVRYVFGEEDIEVLESIKRDHPEYLVFESPLRAFGDDIVDSSTRYGFYVLKAGTTKDLQPYLPHRT